MSLSVFICEDNTAQRILMEHAIISHIALKDYDIRIVLSTHCPAETLEYIKAHPQQNSLYLLDIDLQHPMDGMALAREIKHLDLTGRIIFITTHAERSHLTFRHRIEAMDYIIKDSNYDVLERIQESIDIAYHRFQKTTLETEYFQVKSSMGVQKIPISDILYFETHHVPHKIILHTHSKRIEFRGSLKQVVTMSPHFFVCHKSYIINTSNVVRIHRKGNTNEAEVVNGSIVPVSKSYIAAFVKLIVDRG